jgi:hypothetical protein
MSTGAPAPEPYQVVYAERVRRRLLSLAEVARERGDGEAFVAALKEFHRRLCLYPQFGDPLIDLTREPGQVWIGIVRPLSMRYAVLDDRRLVMVGALPVLLPKAAEGKSE